MTLGPAGETIWQQWTDKAIFDSAGRVIEYESCCTDITKLKEAEYELRKERDNARKYINHAGVILVAINPSQNVKLINTKGCTVLGYSEKEILGTNWFDNYIPEKDRETTRRAFLEMMKGNIKPIEYFENRIVNKNGEERLILWYNALLRDEKGNITGSLSSGEDVTDKRKAEEKLIEAQKMDSIGNLAGGIAHDFNNMLGGILGYASLLLTIEDNPEKKTYIEGIINSSNHAAELTQKLLAFGRRGKNLNQPVSLNSVVNEVYSIIQHTSPGSIKLEKELLQSLYLIDADVSQMHQVVMNICINAIEAMPNGGILTVKTENVSLDELFCSAYRDLTPGQYVKLSIKDTGVGITQEARKHLFEPFFTTKKDGMRKGVGLGLPTAYGIVRNHSGCINVYSEPGLGSAFTIYLPKGKCNAPDQSSNHDHIIHSGAGTVLIVEDEELTMNVARDMVKHLGYKVLLAKDGVEGVDMYSKHHDEIDIVLLDMIMPNRDGKETFAMMKEINPDINVLLCTGYGRNLQAQSIIDMGAKGLLCKPYQLDVLSKEIKKILCQ
jgi:PAS domain S-box-containing protein